MEEKLYELTDDYQRALMELADMDDEAVQDTLNAMKDTIEVKATNVAKFFGNLEANIAAMKNAEKAMATRRKIIENKSQKLLNYIKVNMEKAGIHEIHAPEFDIKIKKNPPKLIAGEIELIPAKFKTKEINVKLKSNEIKKALKEGKSVKGCRLEQSTRLEIK